MLKHLAVVLTLALVSAAASGTHAQRAAAPEEHEGFAGMSLDSKKPKLTAFFPRESYRQGDLATLEIDDVAPAVTVRVMRAGTVAGPVLANDVITGTPVGRARDIGGVSGRRTVAIPIGYWPSGVYYAELHAPGERIGYAPFVLRPRRLGVHRVAVVMPTMTWQAYNFRDDNGDGRPDTWYYAGDTARLGRPFLNRGVPPYFKSYDLPFLQWLSQTGREADFLSDSDLEQLTGSELKRRYALVVFPGHHEYVTTPEYDAVVDYRNLGGHLMWLSANNFFWRVVKHGDVMTRTRQWRDLGRPESALIGVQYYENDEGTHRGAWLVRGGMGNTWLFADTGLADGGSFGSAGIEADQVTPHSPPTIRIVATIPNLFGDGRNADMTYYSTRSCAEVFAAGAFSLADAIFEPHVEQLVANLWDRMSGGSAPS